MTRDEISERMGWATVVVGMNDRKFPFAAYTDYPIIELGDKPWQTAPMRECRVLGYDGNKYCRVVVEGVELEIKSGYVYEGKGELLPGCRGGDEMTYHDIIRMAREAGLKVGENISGVMLVGSPAEIGLAHITLEEMERFAALVAKHERKACAKVCECFNSEPVSHATVAAEIRKRGEK
jgi:hypothetical protein